MPSSRQIMREPAVRLVQSHITGAVDGGQAVDHACALLRTITSYALGSALAEVGWGLGVPGCALAVADLLRPGVSDDLVDVAENFCGRSDPDAQFELGLQLILRGLECDASIGEWV